MSVDHKVVEKVGGGGSQDAASIEKNARHFLSEPDLVGVAFSGPGGTSGRATLRVIALTDMFQQGLESGIGPEDIFRVPEYRNAEDELNEQFVSIASPLGCIGLASAAMDDIRSGLTGGYGYGWIRTLPEFFTTYAYSHILREAGALTNVVNPAESIFAGSGGRLDLRATIGGLQRVIIDGALNLVPGFAARRQDGTMGNISRGSTDTVGAAVAVALKQNSGPGTKIDYVLRKDDVNGVTRIDPALLKSMGVDLEVADQLSIPEVETLALNGAPVVNEAVLGIIEGAGVRLLVKNTFDLEHPGTDIVPVEERVLNPELPVSGIASREVTGYKWRVHNADSLPNVIAEVTRVFGDLGVSITEMQTSAGGVITPYISAEQASEHNEALVAKLHAMYGGETTIEVKENLTLIALAGEALRLPMPALEVTERYARVARKHKIQVKGYWQNEEEPNIYLTVPTTQAIAFIQALYREFFPAKSEPVLGEN